ncbi:DUF3578 domain-containing protein [Novosphingobium sp. FSY-8]|uniref:DUF3578 domain-containing protein n=1 Tax=Novosphingobium ovatum TaxID=1908523 RepID=A0ABW9XHG8_9SPHN|nr:DUF3578 domain-containing protein [Novosphingobium ovatum]NBC38009.1 DUF3578 domain-containing protein [Novosphingobium ovatum]
MRIRDGLTAVLSGYRAALQSTFGGHPLAALLRNDLPQAISAYLPTHEALLKVEGSAGVGNWAKGPWVAILNRLITETPQRKFYPVYLFAEDMSGVYLSLNQGMTEVRELYRVNPKSALRTRALNYRDMLGSSIAPFTVTEINLAPARSANPTAYYEAGNICSAYYPANALPSEERLVADLIRMVALYESLIATGTGDDGAESDTELFFEGGSEARRTHLRVERNSRLAKAVKQRKGCRCEVCQLDFRETYGALGAGYIEAHHLVPLAQLSDVGRHLDPVKDFAVLCANCHRMAHKLTDPSDIAALKVAYKAKE